METIEERLDAITQVLNNFLEVLTSLNARVATLELGQSFLPQPEQPEDHKMFR